MLAKPQTLLALLALSSFAQAGWFDERLNEVARRQADTNVSETASVPEATESSTPSTESTTTDTPSPTPVVSTTPSVSPTPSASPTPTTTPSATPASTTPVSSTTLVSSTTTVRSSSTTASVEESVASTTAPPSKTTIRQTITTIVNGQAVTSVFESTSTLPQATNAAGLANGSETTGGGMSSKTKSTVIGVVVGIGGAILLAGLAVVAWRIWGRKKNGDEGDDLMEYNRPDTGAEKTSGSSNGASSNPFQSTLENYHNPAKQVNASSNF